MKHSLRILSVLLLLVITGSLSSAFAQSSTRFAFVNKERNLIYIHEGDQKDTLFLPIASQKFGASRLAVLGSAPDGKSLLVAGRIHFAAIGTGEQDSIQGFFRVPIPEHGKPLDSVTMFRDGRILRRVFENTTKVLPLGAITPDGNSWYGIWMSSAPNNPKFIMYHGNFNQNDIFGNLTDTAFTEGADSFDGGYHMTNVTTTADGNMFIFAIIDKLQSGGLEIVRMVRWRPGSQPLLSDITNRIPDLGLEYSPDKSTAFAIRGAGTADNPRLFMAVVTKPDDEEITIYELANLAQPSFGAAASRGTIYRASLPQNYDFFTGYTGNNDDVYAQAPQQGNGGDMMFNRDGSKVIFVTRSFIEDLNTRPQYSAIFEYDISGGSITELYNDVTKEERQPIFVDGTGILPEPPQVVTVTPSNITLPAAIYIGEDTTLVFTIKNTGTVDASIKSVALGSSPGFAITSNSIGATAPYAFTLIPEQEATFTLTFTPTSVGNFNGTMTVSWSDDSSRTVSFSGRGANKPIESVERPYTEVFTLSVSPNPMTSASVVTLKGVETSNVSLELVDATGRAVWNATSKLNAGTESKFDLNAQELSAGSYFLIVRANDVVTMRQVVVTK